MTHHEYGIVETFQYETIDDNVAQGVSNLLEELTNHPHGQEIVKERLQILAGSELTSMIGIRALGQSEIASILTVNRVDLLSSKITWIDDVVTKQEHRGRQLYDDRHISLARFLMEHVEPDAKEWGSHLLLTSSQQREGARNLYQSLRYKERGIVWRRDLSDVEPDEHPDTRVERIDAQIVTAITKAFPEQENLSERLETILRCGALFISYDEDSIGAISVAYPCPIPTGNKPWLSVPYMTNAMAEEKVVSAAEQWIATQWGSANVFIASDVKQGFPPRDPGYRLRDTSLFIKDLTETS